MEMLCRPLTHLDLPTLQELQRDADLAQKLQDGREGVPVGQSRHG